jgi:hypothetical protein
MSLFKAMKASTITLIIVAILFSSLINGFLTYLVGKGIQCNFTETDTSKLLFWSGFFVSVLSMCIGAVLNSCSLKALDEGKLNTI